MKIIKLPGRRLPAIHTQLAPSKKALLIGIQTIREDAIEVIQENDKITTEDRLNEEAKTASKRKKGKQRENGGRKRGHETALKGPHHDVIAMRQLLIGGLSFLSCFRHSYH